MKVNMVCLAPAITLIFLLSGCTVRHYVVVKDRVDQDLSAGNHGYIAGQAPQALEESERRTTRNTYVTEIELPAVMKSSTAPAPLAVQAAAEPVAEPTAEPAVVPETGILETDMEKTENDAAAIQPRVLEKYKVESGDTLQKISNKFYGTSKKWNLIFKANQDTLKSPEKIYPGQELNIPNE